MTENSILIIDDEMTDRYILKRLLSETGIAGSITEAENGSEGIEFLNNYEENRKRLSEDFPPRLIFLDINMPVSNGFDFLDKFADLIKVLDFSSSIVLMYSSSQRSDEVERALSYDSVKCFILKISDSAEKLKAQILEAMAS